MNEEMIKKVTEAIDEVKNWPIKGWKMTFGPRNVEVNSLQAALDQPKDFVYKIEAVDYWQNVSLIGHDIIEYLEMTRAALKEGDMKAAENKVYYAQYLEKPLEHLTGVSKPLWESIHNA